jgi:hypothetical protein
VDYPDVSHPWFRFGKSTSASGSTQNAAVTSDQLDLHPSPDWGYCRMTNAKASMMSYFLLAVCAGLICFGILTIVLSSGFFMNLLGAGILAAGGSAAYLILSTRSEQIKRTG